MFRRRFFIRLALVLLVALPLRSMAAIEMLASPVAQHETMVAAAAMADDCGMSVSPDASTDATTPGHATHAAHGTCSVCCCVTVVAAHEFHWPARRDTPSAPPVQAVLTAPAVILDGLERPPRSLLV